jgi:hypothetical protein
MISAVIVLVRSMEIRMQLKHRETEDTESAKVVAFPPPELRKSVLPSFSVNSVPLCFKTLVSDEISATSMSLAWTKGEDETFGRACRRGQETRAERPTRAEQRP